MAAGDSTIFDEAKLAMLDGTHDLDTDVIKVAFISDATVPTAADLTPVLGDYTEVSGGNFVSGGDTMSVSLTEASGTVTYDFTTDISNAKNASNPNNVFYAIVYNSSKTDQALGFVEIAVAGADGTAGLISLTWGANYFTLS